MAAPDSLKSPAEWREPGELTEEQIAEIMKPIGEPAEPAPPVEVEPIPEVVIEGEAAPEEPPIVLNLEEEPPVEPAPPASLEVENAHEKMVEDLLRLHTEIYRARYNQEPDEKSLQQYRALYGRQSDEVLQKQRDLRTQELQGAQGGKAA